MKKLSVIIPSYNDEKIMKKKNTQVNCQIKKNKS